MQSIDQLYHCTVPGQVFGLWQFHCHLRIYSPHPEVQVVVISDMKHETGRFIPYQIDYLANLIVEEFQLNPQAVVWIEHYSHQAQQPSGASLNRILFDWKQGKATNPRWVPVADGQTNLLLKKVLQSV